MKNKIIKILDYFTGEDKQYSKVWNIGTDMFVSLKRMIENFNKSAYSTTSDSFIIEHTISSSFEDRYIMVLNGDIVTPSNRSKKVSWGAMRQYLQIAASLGLISWNGEMPKNYDKLTIQINPKFWQIDINDLESDLTDLFLKSLFISVDSYIKWTRNFGLSLFLSLILKEDENLFLSLPDKYFIKPRTTKNEKVGDKLILASPKGIDYIKYINGIKTNIFGNEVKDTYSTITNKILNKYNFVDIVNKLMNRIVNPNDEIFDDFIFNKELESNKIKRDKLEFYIKQLNSRRCKLRENIKINRVGTDDENFIYTDLENSSPNNIELDLQDACHIYDIYKLKNKLSNYLQKTDVDKIDEFIVEQIIDEADDFNNGIFMSKPAHKIFDKNYAWFNEDGKLIYQESCKDIVKRAFGENINNVYIKKRTLTNQMKKYIIFRNKYNIK